MDISVTASGISQYAADIMTPGFSFICIDCSNPSDAFYRFRRFGGLVVKEIVHECTEARKRSKGNKKNLYVEENKPDTTAESEEPEKSPAPPIRSNELRQPVAFASSLVLPKFHSSPKDADSTSLRGATAATRLSAVTNVRIGTNVRPGSPVPLQDLKIRGYEPLRVYRNNQTGRGGPGLCV